MSTTEIEVQVENLVANIRRQANVQAVHVSEQEFWQLKQRVPKSQMKSIDDDNAELWSRLSPLIRSVYNEAISRRGNNGADEVLLVSPYEQDGFVVQIAVKRALVSEPQMSWVRRTARKIFGRIPE